MNKRRVSIIIPTYNRAKILRYCLDSLVEQTADKTHYEVIVINNNSTDDTEEIAKDFVRKHSNFLVLQEKEQGLSHARNRGFKEAKADYVAYLDDDTKPFKDYVDRMIWVINNYDFDAFGGRYVPWYLHHKPRWFRDEYASNGYMLKKIGELRAEFISGGVIVFKKSVLESLGGFPTGIGMNAKRLSYGEETNVQVKMRAKGLKIGFDPDLVVEHMVADYKLSVFWFFKSAYASGRDAWAAFNIEPSLSKVFKEVLSLGVLLMKNLYIFTPKLVQNDYYIQNWCIEVISPLLNKIGSILSAMRIILSTLVSGTQIE